MTDTTTPTAIEQGYIEQGYELPAGYTWEHVHQSRARWGHGEIYVPTVVIPGVCAAWSVPYKDGRPMRHS